MAIFCLYSLVSIYCIYMVIITMGSYCIYTAYVKEYDMINSRKYKRIPLFIVFTLVNTKNQDATANDAKPLSHPMAPSTMALWTSNPATPAMPWHTDVRPSTLCLMALPTSYQTPSPMTYHQ
jgi:hypothetical protein